MKAVLTGAGVALAAGLLLGAAMRPDLMGGGDPSAEPQPAAAWTDRPSELARTNPPIFASSAKTPDYVLGTDFVKLVRPAPPAPKAERVANDYERPSFDVDDPPIAPRDVEARDMATAEAAEAAARDASWRAPDER